MTNQPKKRVPAKPCNVLPKDARDALIAASQLPNERQRQLAVQEAIERAQRRYPQFFKFN